jgi:hypothetical protein
LDRLVGRAPTDLVEWVEPVAPDALAVRRADLRLKDSAALIVRSEQVCVVGARAVADLIGPGRHALSPTTLPNLAAAKVAGGAGTFRADVSFVSVALQSSVPWATVASVVAKDPDAGTVRAKAGGTIGFAVTDPVTFVREVVAAGTGTGVARSDLAALVTSQFSEIFRTGRVDGADLLGPKGRLGLVAGEQLAPILRAVGVTLTRFTVDSVSVSPEVRRPHRPFAGGGSDGYRAELPPPMFPEVVPEPIRSGFPALPAELADILEPPIPRDNGPKSNRIPLVEAPEGVFAARQSAGPKTDRLLLADARPAGTDHTEAPDAPFEAPLAAGSGPRSTRLPAPLPPTPAAPHRPPGPPPLPATLEFYVGLNGAVVGPFDLIALAARVRDGSLGRKTLVWRTGMDDWLAAELVTELTPMFAGPPPLPPS